MPRTATCRSTNLQRMPVPPFADLKRGLSRLVKFMPWVLCALGLPACTTVNIYAGDGRVAVHHGFGFVNLQPALGSTPIVFHGTSLGLQSGPWGHSLGYAQTSLTLLPIGCHVIVMPATEPQASSPALQALRNTDPCAVPIPPSTPTPRGD